MSRILVCLAVAVVSLVTATTALADGPPTVTRTVTDNFVDPFTFTGDGACSGQGIFEGTEVLQITSFPSGVEMLTDHLSGTATFVSDANGMTYTGPFSDVFRLESLPHGAAFSFGETTHFRLTAPDGSSLHFNEASHTTSTPSGTITTTFDNPVCLG
jgi:hypothetical protein